MRKFLLLSFSFLILAACNSSVNASVIPTFDNTATPTTLSPTGTAAPATTSTPTLTPTSTPVHPLMAHEWSQAEPLITYTNGWGDGGCGFERSLPVEFTLLPNGNLYLRRWNENPGIAGDAQILTTTLSRQETCNLLNSVDQAGFFDYDPSTYVKDPRTWHRPIAGPDNTDISVRAWRANSVSLFFLNGFLDPMMMDEMKNAWADSPKSEAPEFPTILPAIRNTFRLLNQYQPPEALHDLKPERLGVWLYADPNPTRTDVIVDWPLKSHTLVTAASPVADSWEPPAMILTDTNAVRVYGSFHQELDVCGVEVREGNKLYRVFARPLLPNEFNSSPLPKVSLSCSPSDGWIDVP